MTRDADAPVPPKTGWPRTQTAALTTASGDGEEGWLMPYLDTLTLLLTLFVVLLSFADFTPGADKRSAEQDGLRVPGPTPAKRPALLGEQALAGLDDAIEVRAVEGQVRLVISDRILFDTARAQLTAKGFEALESLLPVLSADDHRITVAGHTDDRPIATERYPSNWELSAARAGSVVRYFLGRGIDAERLRAIGYADTRPVADNATAQGRARNRRVEIIIHRSAANPSTRG